MTRGLAKPEGEELSLDALPPDVRAQIAPLDLQIKANPDDTPAWLAEAAVYESKKLEPNALAAYRKVAVQWKDAVWVWESVVSSRPYVVAIMSNIARGYSQLGDNDKALEYLARCEKLQPRSVSVRSLKIVLYSRMGKAPEAISLARQYMEEGTYDFDLLNAAYLLGTQNRDAELIIQSLELRQKSFQGGTVDTFLKLADVYANLKKDDAGALAYYRSALAAAPASSKESIRQQIPQAFVSRL